MSKRSWFEANGSNYPRHASDPNQMQSQASMDARLSGGTHRSSFGMVMPQNNEMQVPVPTKEFNQQQSQGQPQFSSFAAKVAPAGPLSSTQRNDPTIGTTAQAALPAITRKVKACAACRKQKMKCDMPNDEPPCTRCQRRNLSCVLNRSLQSLIDDTRQTELMQADMTTMHAILTDMCRHLGLAIPPPLSSITDGKQKAKAEDAQRSEGENDQENACEVSPPTSPTAVHAPIDTFLDIAKLGSPASGTGDSPLGVGYRKRPPEIDLISKGIITLAAAEHLTERYFSRLDQFLYGIGSAYGNLANLRRASPVLLAAVCTVSALHEPQDQTLYENCNKEFRRLISRSTFEKRGVEYIRALCIGSFWLSDASRILSSDAIRRAADVRLHRYFYQLTDPNAPLLNLSDKELPAAEMVDRVRLWYLLYVCDQHLSVLHNRPSILRCVQDIVVNWESYLEGNEKYQITDSDVRILSQVALLLIMGQVREMFGSEIGEPVPKSLLGQLNNYNRQLDQWFSSFSPRFRFNELIGDFPRKGLQMHYNFGKLHLGHHVFRGLKNDPIPTYFLPAATMAHSAAASIFDFILNDQELQKSLLGMPHYFHIMIAFAGCFLLEVSSKYSQQLSIDIQNNVNLIGKVLAHLHSIPCIAQHPIHRMTTGLRKKIFDFVANINGAAASSGDVAVLRLPPELEPMTSIWLENTENPSLPVDPAGQTSQHTGFPISDRGAMNPPPPPLQFDNSFFEFGEFDFPDMRLDFLT